MAFAIENIVVNRKRARELLDKLKIEKNLPRPGRTLWISFPDSKHHLKIENFGFKHAKQMFLINANFEE